MGQITGGGWFYVFLVYGVTFFGIGSLVLSVFLERRVCQRSLRAFENEGQQRRSSRKDKGL